MISSQQSERRRPPALQPGDTVGIVAPASGFRREDFHAGCDRLRQLGYQPYYLPSIFERDLYFAGSVERRIHELHEMFSRTEVRAILCARGGYGCNYLLPYLDLELIRANPKIFAGCSDVTTLLTYLCDHAGLVTFHAPMVAGDFSRHDGIDVDAWSAAVSSGKAYPRMFGRDEVEPLVEGVAQGVLYGGCLSLLCASLGTPYEVRTERSILFLEDRGEKPYQIDRMLMQLKLAGKFEGVTGIIFGQMLDCGQQEGTDRTLHDVIMRILGGLGVPIAFGLRSGHVSSRSFTLPIGVGAALNVGHNVVLSFDAAVQLEPASVRVSHS
ncbi:MAG: LD-carboxypeptidase [Candidatus Korobacteraceae bacterium]